MVSFLDGPAAGQTLLLRRTPLLLRVVVKDGQWDALDMPTDEPRPGETVHVYRASVFHGTVHIKAARRSASGFYQRVGYSVLDEQPHSAVTRNSAAWQAWCHSVGQEILKRFPAP